MEIVLRAFQVEDLKDYYKLTHPSRKYHELNGPYFKKATEEELKQKIEAYDEAFKSGDQPFKQSKAIVEKATNRLLGQVSWYWKSEETNWLEIGLVIFDENDWGKGIGYKAMNAWIQEVFKERPDLVRIGLTTWSGNTGMIKLAEKLGLKCEACYKKARVYRGRYYDSLSYGILKEDYENRT